MRTPILLAAAGIFAIGLATTVAGAERAVVIPAAAIDVPAAKGPQVAVLAGGCFWGMEAVFERVKGVTGVTSGYAGGTRETARYDAVSTETTRHAEAIRIAYDPAKVSYATLLRVYFSIAHDPTQVNRQGPDSGPSYRSAIFPQTPDQARVARAYVAQLDRTGAYAKPIATRIEQGRFFPAEAYHQNFFDRNPAHPYIVTWDKPKVAAFRAGFPTLAR
ncbi:peptide-methionine (S)-S-oxide reductase MsrA [Sphingomonas sp.]|jgi:peptide-methionine (S)-S-oxide reductase|uniref:peptide-methionine (S)-S-oxide reductase MsrA n=1 Tax=Sphingomonas sp. TaxID=28214 RepID=UPI002EDACD82